ncbi:uncharacterized protein [Antedon mediterranea]|uniref:uncharacterized protein isoform X1 n=1 Tax=Antedon mediterranea TaxID=105859 RepID=UPI003AF74B9B
MSRLFIPPNVPKFFIDLRCLDASWDKDTVLTLRAGDDPAIRLMKSSSRFLAQESGFNPCDHVELSADRGYILWTNPRGSIEVRFKYGKTGDDFKCFIDPQHMGIKIYQLKGYRKEMIVDGKQPMKENTSRHRMKDSPVRQGQNNFEFNSHDGEVRLVLEMNRDHDSHKPHAFKLNYVLAL